ncbi:acyl-CoA dehydrogenase, partial [Aureobasidium melanogenum]
MPSDRKLYGDLSPWAEPAWYNSLSSPYYNDSHRSLRDAIRTYVDDKIMPYQEEWEEKGEVPEEESMAFIRAGMVLQDFPPQYRRVAQNLGGVRPEEYDIFHFIVLHDELARVHGGPLSGLNGSSTIGAPPILSYGTQEQKDKWIPGIFTGETKFCLGATEASGGSDLANLKTSAKKTDDGKFYIVNGTKGWVTGALKSTHITAAVRTGGPGIRGVSVLVIPMDSPGVTAKKIYNSGNNAGGSAWVFFENVKVPVENLVGPENNGFPALMANFNQERLLIAVAMNRKARVCLSTALNYAQERETWGNPLFDNQVIRHKLTNVAKDIEAHFACRIAMAKIFGGRMLELACREAQQVMGGAGYQKGAGGAQVEQISRDLRVLVVGGGSEEIIGDLAVRQELALTKRKEAAMAKL